jgi:hypothetical protein
MQVFFKEMTGLDHISKSYYSFPDESPVPDDKLPNLSNLAHDK